ncbi:MAG: class I SAM-dependent methyltransferase [Ardenticatenaceae bacterium]|nr:class I SAM-dependent methyltransferase [Ardenticatenaceae bacterium]
MSNEKTVSNHYLHGDLLQAIQSAIAKSGKTIDNVTVEDLASVDEFHIGGRFATKNLLSQLNFPEQHHILDVGCGLGGAARFVSSNYSNHVTGIDLTPEYIDTGRVLCEWVNLENDITLHHGSALSMPFEDEMFDGGYMLHVGMNIADKNLLFKEIFRVLREGATFGIYDIMRMEKGELTFPVPWATDGTISNLASPKQYRHALIDAGFEVSRENNRRDFALEFFKKQRKKVEANGGPPPLGLHTLMKESTPIKINNMVDNIKASYIAPVEMIAHKSKKI